MHKRRCGFPGVANLAHPTDVFEFFGTTLTLKACRSRNEPGSATVKSVELEISHE
jgi:hypothetical protein